MKRSRSLSAAGAVLWLGLTAITVRNTEGAVRHHTAHRSRRALQSARRRRDEPMRRPRIFLEEPGAATQQPMADQGSENRMHRIDRIIGKVSIVPEPVHPVNPVPPVTGSVRRNPKSWTAWLLPVLYDTLLGIVFLICVYTVRHYWFTMSRLVGTQRHPYIDVETADWPSLSVLVAAHNEEAVIEQILEALLDADYPPERLQIMPVNDRSTDRTREIIEAFTRRFPDRITPFHRTEGKPGKAAALRDATARAAGEILIIFDADYVPGRNVLKQLVSAFFDPEVGAVMGRVVPVNVRQNLLTRLLDLERSGGYQVDQQARMNLKLVPQYGGTVGGVRRRALESVGGWREDCLAEDTDLTFRLLLGGWKTVYQNRSECYEEVPETWPVRVRQIMRWARGHNQAMSHYGGSLLWSRRVGFWERLDGLLLLGIYAMSFLILLGWIVTLTLFYLGAYPLQGVIVILAVVCYSGLGNFAAFFEIAAAARLDGWRGRIRLLPLNLFTFMVSLISCSRATLSTFLPRRRKSDLVWHKTQRFRKEKV